MCRADFASAPANRARSFGRALSEYAPFAQFLAGRLNTPRGSLFRLRRWHGRRRGANCRAARSSAGIAARCAAEGLHEVVVAAGAKRKGGRPPAMTDEMKARVRPLLEFGAPVQDIARQVGSDTSTIYKYRAELSATGPGGPKRAARN